MSGGSMDYLCFKMEEFKDCFDDTELDDLFNDFISILHDREWYKSGDYNSGIYNESVIKFKEKWFNHQNDSVRLKKYIDEKIHEAYEIIGIKDYCKDCSHFAPNIEGQYGWCGKHPTCLWHLYENACDDFERGKVYESDQVVHYPKRC